MKRKRPKVKLREIAARLEAAGIEDAGYEASVLVEHFEGDSRAAQLAFDRDYTGDALLSAVSRREKREPLQYIMGCWDFMGYTFKVTPDTLIPRSDTELLCEFLVKNLPRGGRFADLCTGSGCIPIAALNMREDATGVCVELYPETLKVARENGDAHKVGERLEYILGDVTQDVLEGEFDIIVSNPPYVTLEEMNGISPEVEKEPEHALTDGGDGLSIIRKIIEIYPRHIKAGGYLAIEFGWKQGEAAAEIAEKFGFESEILCDLEDRDRVIVIKL